MRLPFSKQLDQRYVEELGFLHGTQNVSPESTQKEITAQFLVYQENVRHDAAENISVLEATIDKLEMRAQDVQAHWEKLREETDGRPPHIAAPLLGVALVLLALIGEIILLSPVMDGFGIADPSWQYVAAAALVIVIAGLFHLAISRLREKDEINVDQVDPGVDQHTITTRLRSLGITSFLTLLVFALVVTLGWWRAEEMIFAGTLQASDLGSFLGENPMLTRLCIVLLTAGLPIFAAVAYDWSLAGLRMAWEWRKAQRRNKKLVSQLAVARKALESAVEKRDRKIAALIEQKNQFENAYLQNVEHGCVVGAKQTPLWQAVLKIAAVTTLILAVCLLIDPQLEAYLDSANVRIFIYGLLTVGLGGVYAFRTIKAWDRPTARQLMRNRAIKWSFEESKRAQGAVINYRTIGNTATANR